MTGRPGCDGNDRSRSVTDDIFDAIGREADVVDSLIAAEQMPLPADLAKRARVESLTALRDRLRAIVVEGSGENPWERA